MDVCLCQINVTENRLIFAGACRPVYIVKTDNTNSKPIVIKGDRKPIGGKQREKIRTFTNNSVEIKKNDMIYLTSDGFIDQQNCKNRKFGSKRFIEFLHGISTLNCDKQSKLLQERLSDHQTCEKQRDDITVVGIRV